MTMTEETDSVPSEHSKRVYQGVRVKHTVKDLLAEKRSRQTNVPFKYNTGTNSSQPSTYVQMSGSHVIPSYYGVRRPYLSDSDLPHCHSSKQYSADVYSSSLSSKSFGCDPPAVSGYQHLFDPYITETFGDYRTPTFPSATSSIFTPQPLTPLIPSFPNESSHFLLRDSWDSVQETVSQGDAICDTLQQMQATAANCQSQHHGNHSLPDTDSASPSQYKSISRNSSGPSQSSQPYSLHPLEEMHFSSGYPVTSAYGCAPFMTVPSELAAKTIHLSSEESADTTATSMLDMSSWAKEDTSTSWPLYEVRRTY
ncbi:POU domain class 2-associating factor 2 [Pristis pectinata]|uniref:POU domain class 2-associating factor 2 n=1 Tax=Pristis pectinata TaxID=685728 RepID=UPI00223D9B53|nr:POU domain class 2-associating factor 2 [Pristis pectinata]